MRRLILSSALAAIALTAPAASAQIYKWVDDRGVVNYSSDAPAKRNAILLDPKSARVSTYSTGDAQMPAASTPTSYEERALSDRIDRLERGIEAERYARQVQLDAQMQTAADAWYAQCLRDRRVDCDYAGTDPGYYAPYYGPVAIAGRHVRERPIPHRNLAAPKPARRPAFSSAPRQM